MSTQADVRRIAMALPAVEEANDKFAFSVMNNGKAKGFVWVWQERITPKKPRVPNDSVIAVRVANLGQKDLLLSAEPGKFFTEPHYNGFPSVLVRLDSVSATDLERLVLSSGLILAKVRLGERGGHVANEVMVALDGSEKESRAVAVGLAIADL